MEHVFLWFHPTRYHRVLHPLPTPSSRLYTRIYNTRIFRRGDIHKQRQTEREREKVNRARLYICIYKHGGGYIRGMYMELWNAARPSWCAHAADRGWPVLDRWIAATAKDTQSRCRSSSTSTTPICSGPALLCAPSLPIPLLRRNEAAVATHRCGRRLLRNHPLGIDFLFFFFFFRDGVWHPRTGVCCKLLSFRDLIFLGEGRDWRIWRL